MQTNLKKNLKLVFWEKIMKIWIPKFWTSPDFSFLNFKT